MGLSATSLVQVQRETCSQGSKIGGERAGHWHPPLASGCITGRCTSKTTPSTLMLQGGGGQLGTGQTDRSHKVAQQVKRFLHTSLLP